MFNRMMVYQRSLLGAKFRFALPIVLIAVAKILGAALLYERVSQIFEAFHTPFMDMWREGGPTQPWLYLFSAWDTGHYLDIAANWYQYPKYVFFPAYPALTRVVGTIIGDPWLGAFIISTAFGLGSIPLFQLICEQYTTKDNAITTTLLTMTFPYIFLFTTVSYTESMFLFFTILTWYLHLKKRNIPSIMAAIVATLTKPYGITIVIPIAISLFAERKLRKILSITLPVAALLGWMCYLYIRTGDAFAFLTQQEYWKSQLGIGAESGQKYFTATLNFLLGTSESIPRLSFASIAFIVLSGYLVFNVYRMDAPLGIYSIFLYLGLLLFGNLYSCPRYFAFIFPVWLIVQGKIRSVLLLSITVVFFLLNSYAMWVQFIMMGWIS